MEQGGPGVKSHEAAMRRRSAKLTRGPLNPTRLVSVFNEKMRLEDHGEPTPLTKKDQQMLAGMVKLYRVNDVDPQEVFAFVRDLVHYWNDLRSMDTVTLKGKAWVLSVRPSLRDIMICRESLYSNLLGIKETLAREARAAERHDSTPSQGDSTDTPEPVVLRRRKKNFGPTQADIDAEYERLKDE
jgi:hypothetical protein